MSIPQCVYVCVYIYMHTHIDHDNCVHEITCSVENLIKYLWSNFLEAQPRKSEILLVVFSYFCFCFVDFLLCSMIPTHPGPNESSLYPKLDISSSPMPYDLILNYFLFKLLNGLCVL